MVDGLFGGGGGGTTTTSWTELVQILWGRGGEPRGTVTVWAGVKRPSAAWVHRRVTALSATGAPWESVRDQGDEPSRVPRSSRDKTPSYQRQPDPDPPRTRHAEPAETEGYQRLSARSQGLISLPRSLS